MFKRRKQPPVSRADALSARPTRLADAEMHPRADGGGALKVTLEPSRLGRWLFRVPAGTTKTFEFDAIGVFVWNLCDGRNSVQQIIRKLAKQFSLNLREAEVPTVQFLHMLAKKGLVGMVTKVKQKS